jgi:hypothetical protein
VYVDEMRGRCERPGTSSLAMGTMFRDARGGAVLPELRDGADLACPALGRSTIGMAMQAPVGACLRIHDSSGRAHNLQAREWGCSVRIPRRIEGDQTGDGESATFHDGTADLRQRPHPNGGRPARSGLEKGNRQAGGGRRDIRVGQSGQALAGAVHPRMGTACRGSSDLRPEEGGVGIRNGALRHADVYGS